MKRRIIVLCLIALSVCTSSMQAQGGEKNPNALSKKQKETYIAVKRSAAYLNLFSLNAKWLEAQKKGDRKVPPVNSGVISAYFSYLGLLNNSGYYVSALDEEYVTSKNSDVEKTLALAALAELNFDLYSLEHPDDFEIISGAIVPPDMIPDHATQKLLTTYRNRFGDNASILWVLRPNLIEEFYIGGAVAGGGEKMIIISSKPYVHSYIVSYGGMQPVFDLTLDEAFEKMMDIIKQNDKIAK